MILSVVICAHNPRRDYLDRALGALRKQTLDKEQWELLLIDNASREPLAPAWDLTWHPQARHVREENLGLTAARLRGIRESRGELLVFVDDDNVVDADYLKTAVDLLQSRPWLGAAGGSCLGEFETPPEDWAKDMLGSLAVREVKKEEWACLPGTKALDIAPYGAGMIVRRVVALHYAKLATGDSLRCSLDRKGTSLLSAGDTDMALCACALGLAVGRFPQLRLTHLIPAARLEKNYLLRLMEAMAVSVALLRFIWDGLLPVRMEEPRFSRSEKLFRAYQQWRHQMRGGTITTTFDDEVRDAHRRGLSQAVELLQDQNSTRD
jgi:glycosyltransferase involved in cell wall biosynthesis